MLVTYEEFEKKAIEYYKSVKVKRGTKRIPDPKSFLKYDKSKYLEFENRDMSLVLGN